MHVHACGHGKLPVWLLSSHVVFGEQQLMVSLRAFLVCPTAAALVAPSGFGAVAHCCASGGQVSALVSGTSEALCIGGCGRGGG